MDDLGWGHAQWSEVFSFPSFFFWEDETITFPIVSTLPITCEVFRLDMSPRAVPPPPSRLLILPPHMPSIFSSM